MIHGSKKIIKILSSCQFQIHSVIAAQLYLQADDAYLMAYLYYLALSMIISIIL